MKTYEKYKPSAIAWLGDIPEHWSAVKIKHTFNERVDKGYPSLPLLSATQSRGVIPQSLYENRTVVAQKDLHLLKLVEIGDFVISLRSFQGGIEYAYYQGIISPAYTVMNAKDSIYKGYFRYLAKSEDFIRLLKTCVTGIREGQNINYSLLKKSHLPIPPLVEQEQIVRFLDSKVGQINRFVRGKKREIELLKELKQAEINQAVTKGLDPTAPLKDSGIEWLGEIPKHWEVRRLKSLVRLVNEKDSSANKHYIGLENIQSWTGNYILSEEIIAEGISNVFLQGDILFGKLRPYLAKCIIAPFDGVCSSELLVLRGFIGDSRFLNLSLLSSKLIYHINSSTYGAKMPRANWTFIGNSLFPYPPITEQQEIVAHLNERMAKIDNIIASTENEIKLVQEYKTRLISDAVTGKIDVRNIEIPETDNFEDPTEQEIEITEDSTEITQ